MKMSSPARISRRNLLQAAGLTLATPGLVRPASAQPVEAGVSASDFGSAVPITRVRSARPLLALTFDDGPHATLTPQLLDLLAERNVRATFYVVGNRISHHQGIMGRIADEGHEIGNHSWSHPSLGGLSDAAILSQIDRTSAAIVEAVGRPPVTMRPPYGNLSPRQTRMLYASRGLQSVLWSVDTEDWRRSGEDVMVNRILSQSRPGGVILAHDIVAQTIRAMPVAIDGLLTRGYEFVTVSELMGWPRWNTRRTGLLAHS